MERNLIDAPILIQKPGTHGRLRGTLPPSMDSYFVHLRLQSTEQVSKLTLNLRNE